MDRLGVFKALGDNTRYAIYLELARAARPLTTADIADLVAQAVAELEVRREHGLQGFRTGIRSFDDLASPMFQPGRVVGVAARGRPGAVRVVTAR